jgi:hypothetical protein
VKSAVYLRKLKLSNWCLEEMQELAVVLEALPEELCLQQAVWCLLL